MTDAGTPAVSDPGYRLVRAAIDAGIRVEAIPGASAVLAALVSSGLPDRRLRVRGLSSAEGRRAARPGSQALRDERRTIVFFEAPHRIRATLGDALARSATGEAAVGRELTKLHEELVRGPISAVLGPTR